MCILRGCELLSKQRRWVEPCILVFRAMEHRAGLGRQYLVDILLGKVFGKGWWTFPNITNFFQMPGLRVKIWSLVKSH